MKSQKLDDLIDRFLDGSLDAAQARELSGRLEESPEARERYWEHASLHALLEDSLQTTSLQSAVSKPASLVPKQGGFPGRSPITAVAAGMVMGVFCAAMVFAYTRSSASQNKVLKTEILFESFEGKVEETLSPRFPDQAGAWFGQVTTGVTPRSEIEAPRGKTVARFEKIPDRKYSYAWQIINLDQVTAFDGKVPDQLEVKASFATSAPSPGSRYQIRLAAFSQAPEEIRPIWNRENVLYNTVLQHSGRNYRVKPGDTGWKKLYSRIDLPPGARSVVICFGVNAASEEEHYLDAIRARMMTTPSQPAK